MQGRLILLASSNFSIKTRPQAPKALFLTSQHQATPLSFPNKRIRYFQEPLFLTTFQTSQNRDPTPNPQYHQPHISTMKLSLASILAIIALSVSASPLAQKEDMNPGVSPATNPVINSLCTKATGKTSPQPDCPHALSLTHDAKAFAQ